MAVQIKDWFHKLPLGFPVNELRDHILPRLETATWSPSRYSQAPGTDWCLLALPEDLRQKIADHSGFPIFPDFYVWNYRKEKRLLVHKDGNDPGEFRNIVGVIPLIGDFICEVYSEEDHTSPFDQIQYGPGDLLILNNTKYFHGGRVLSETRLSLHFYLDFHNNRNLSLEQVFKELRRG